MLQKQLGSDTSCCDSLPFDFARIYGARLMKTGRPLSEMPHSPGPIALSPHIGALHVCYWGVDQQSRRRDRATSNKEEPGKRAMAPPGSRPLYSLRNSLLRCYPEGAIAIGSPSKDLGRY